MVATAVGLGFELFPFLLFPFPLLLSEGELSTFFSVISTFIAKENISFPSTNAAHLPFITYVFPPRLSLPPRYKIYNCSKKPEGLGKLFKLPPICLQLQNYNRNQIPGPKDKTGWIILCEISAKPQRFHDTKYLLHNILYFTEAFLFSWFHRKCVCF